MTEEFDIDSILNKAVNNCENEPLLEKSFQLIELNKTNILKRLNLNNSTFKDLLHKLENYMLIDELPDLKIGSFIRWISLKNPNIIKLTNGGIIIDVKVENSGINIVLKNNINKIFQIQMGNNIIFQKINAQEHVLLTALSFINQS